MRRALVGSILFEQRHNCPSINALVIDRDDFRKAGMFNSTNLIEYKCPLT